MIKVSIITVVYNNEQYIESAIKSVLEQTYPNIEYIVIDGASKDKTMEVVKKYEGKIAKWVSEKDKGIYDAMNKGLRLASGDIIGILNSDDIYANNEVIALVVENIEKTGADACFGDLVYVDQKNTDTIVRFWKSSEYQHGKFKWGWMPAHPTFFVKNEIYKKYGVFNTDFRIAADYELMLRFLEKYGIKSCYIPKVMVKMRIGGKSNQSLGNIIKANREAYRAWKINKLKANPLTIIAKPLLKIPQYYKRP